ncbi:chromate transporter [Oscillospiraceae bacterium]|mgnify:FL=1|uniref:chromate transporter n=2 Tax=Allofournierella sp. TaxID=1940256 RepID=UPI0015A94DB6|nr:chromate transporter [Oscillospiraceae bacterium]
MIYLQLFWSFFQIGLFSIGGGYAAMPLIQHQVVEAHAWLTLTQFTDIITIAEMTPGPIAVNSATFVGIHIAGIPGALIATAGCILPSCIIVLTLAHLYFKYRSFLFLKGVLQGLRPAVVGMIASAGLSILLLALFGSGSGRPSFAQLDPVALCLFAAALFVLRKWKKSPILILAGAGVAGLLLYQLV